MTGRDDARAMEAAQLHALRRRAEERRQELGETLAALTERLAEDSHVSTWARRGAQRATLGLGRATAAVVIPATVAALAAWWWWRSTRQAGRRRLSLTAR